MHLSGCKLVLLAFVFHITAPVVGQSQTAYYSKLHDLQIRFEKGDWGAVAQEIDNMLSADTTQVEVRFLKSRLLLYSYQEKASVRELVHMKPLIPREYKNPLRVEWELLMALTHCQARLKGPAKDYYQRTLARLGDLSIELLAEWQLLNGLYHQAILDNPDATWEACQDGLQWLRNHGLQNPAVEGNLLRNMGNISRSRTSLEQALDYYSTELAVYQEYYPQGHLSASIAHYNIGNIYYELGSYQQALDHYLICYRIWEKKGAPGTRYERFLYEGIGDMYWELGNKAQALTFFDKSLLNEPLVNNDKAVELSSQAAVLAEAGDFQAALPYYQKALAFRQRQFGAQHPLTGACNNFVARTHEKKGEKTIALDAYQQSLQMLVPSFDSPDWRNNPKIRSFPGTETYLLSALAGKGRLLYNLHKEDGEIARLVGAFDTYDHLVRLIDSLRVRPIDDGAKIRWANEAFPAYEEAIAVALDLYELKREDRYLEAAFGFCEKSRAFVLRTSAQQGTAGAIAGVPDSLREQEQSLQMGIGEYRAKLLREEQRCQVARPPQIEVWRNKLLELEGAYDQFLRKIQTQYPLYYELKFSADVRSLQEVQQVLSPEAALIEIFEGDSTLFVFCITPQGSHFVRVPVEGMYAEQISTLRENLSSPELLLGNPALSYRHFSSSAYKLYQVVLQELIQNLPHGTRKLIVSLDGQMAYVPLGSLLKSPADTTSRDYRSLPYLFRDFSIRYVPSATIWLGMEKGEKQAGMGPWLGIAPTYGIGNKEFPPLRYNTSELSATDSYFSGRKLEGIAATEGMFRRYAPGAGILHVAAHAVMNDQSPALSHFVFGAGDGHDGLLYTYELYSLSLNADLAILSACNTGTGTLVRGEGIMSLGRAFQFAGCPSILTSLWTVDDQSTAQLMESFYAHILGGMAREDALGAARLDYLSKVEKNVSHPFFWSGFVMVGKGGNLPQRSGIPIYWMLGAITLLMVTVGMYRFGIIHSGS